MTGTLHEDLYNLYLYLTQFLLEWEMIQTKRVENIKIHILCSKTYFRKSCLVWDNVKYMVDCVWNVMAHAQKPDFVFRKNGRVHLNRHGCQFSRLLAAEVCASAVVMLDTPSWEVVKGTGYPLHSPVSPSLPLPCVTVCHYVSTGLYSQTGHRWQYNTAHVFCIFDK